MLLPVFGVSNFSAFHDRLFVRGRLIPLPRERDSPPHILNAVLLDHAHGVGPAHHSPELFPDGPSTAALAAELGPGERRE